MTEINPKKIKIPKEDMMRINENIKRFMLMGVSDEELKKYFYECVMAYREESHD